MKLFVYIISSITLLPIVGVCMCIPIINILLCRGFIDYMYGENDYE